jgi:hypothetical protein
VSSIQWNIEGSDGPYMPAALEVLMIRPNFCLRKMGHTALVQAKAPLTWTAITWSNSASVKFLNLPAHRYQYDVCSAMSGNTPFVPQDARIVNQNGNTSKGVKRRLDNGRTVGDVRGVHHGLPTSYTTPPPLRQTRL